MVPLQEGNQDQFAFIWEGQQYIGLPQCYKHSPTLVQEFAIILQEKEVKVYQYINNILIEGHTIALVQTMQDRIIAHLEGIGLQISKEKIQTPTNEVKFLGIWWKEGSVYIP